MRAQAPAADSAASSPLCVFALRVLATQEWRKSSFAQRRKLLRIMLKFIIDNQETICR